MSPDEAAGKELARKYMELVMLWENDSPDTVANQLYNDTDLAVALLMCNLGRDVIQRCNSSR